MQNKNNYKVIIPIVIAIGGIIGYNALLKPKELVKPETLIVINECNPPNDATAIQYIVPSTELLITRKNYNLLSSNEKDNIDTAIARMKRLPVSDPTSFAFQARIHNGPIDINDLSKPFKTCQHAECCFFLAWHRMYIYFFERILRSKMVNTLPKPALPFWDFQNYNIPKNGLIPAISGTIPAKFRWPANANTNPLYANRNPKFNKYPIGANFNSTIGTTNFNIALSSTSTVAQNYNYFNFQNIVLNAHGDIHATIGRWTYWGGNPLTLKNDSSALANPITAANDPLFFLLHANVDRLWEKWRNYNPANYDPSSTCNTYWVNKQFVFYDELGTKIFLKGSDIINSTASKLKYQYDAVPVATTASPTICTSSANACPVFANASKFLQITNTGINGSYTKINPGMFALSPDLKNFVATNPTAAFNFSETNPNADNIFIELDGVNPILYPDGGVEIYVSQNNLNLATLVSTNNAFAGTINLFGFNDGIMHKNIQSINITQLLKNQGLNFAKLANIQCVFIARGNNVNGIEEPTIAKINIEKFKISIYKSTQLF